MDHTPPAPSSRRVFLVVGVAGVAAGCALAAGCGAPEDAATCADLQSAVRVPEAAQLAVGEAVALEAHALIIARDARGYMAISSRCTHAGCTVKINSQAGTYDCPCHGSSYSLDGTLRRGAVTGQASLPHRAACRQKDGVLVVSTSTAVASDVRTG